MSRCLSAVAVLLVVVATPPIHARQTGFHRTADPAWTAANIGAPPLPAAAQKLISATMIHGNALDSTDRPLVNATVRLRDARFGRIVDTQYTDQSGIFAFKAIQPGTYIVEILGPDQSILAASELLTVNAGEALLAVVKLPFQVPPFAELMAPSNSRSATLLVLQAAALGITALVPTAPISPNQ
jgi:hypothetical protein